MKAILICVVPATGLLAFVIAQYGSIKRAQLRHQKTKDKAAKKDNDKFRAAT